MSVFDICESGDRLFVRCGYAAGRVVKSAFKTAKWSRRDGWNLSNTTRTKNLLNKIEQAASIAERLETAKNEAEELDSEKEDLEYVLLDAKENLERLNKLNDHIQATMCEIDRMSAEIKSANEEAAVLHDAVEKEAEKLIDVKSTQIVIYSILKIVRQGNTSFLYAKDKEKGKELQSKLEKSSEILEKAGIRSRAIEACISINFNRCDKARVHNSSILRTLEKIEE